MIEYMLIDNNDDCWFIESNNLSESIKEIEEENNVTIVDWIYC